MKLRTISQLPPLDDEDKPLPNESLLEVSYPVPDSKSLYTSMKLKFGKMKTDILSSFESELDRSHGFLDERGNYVKVNELKKKVDNAISADQTFFGKKKFNDRVGYMDKIDVEEMGENELITKQQATSICKNYGNFISPKTTYVVSDPENTTPNTMFDEDNFMKWQFDQDGRDSDEFMMDPYSNQKAKPVFAKQTGNLVVYGWLADNGNVAAQEAWVGLFGKVTIGKQDSQIKKWVALQIQPWIIGTKSQALQYVGFNVPVRQKMQLKIMTGFPVNTKNSGFQDPSFNTLTLLSNQPCTFIGYILTND